MPSSLLFATNSEGRVYTLSTNSCTWREFPYLGLEFKKISAVPNFMWAIGGDRQVYVHVHGLDVPIRVKEESYENERWLPIEGFSKTLLPTDRPRYSSADGRQERSFDKIRLPSMAWQWDSDWHLVMDLDGQQLSEDGWMYALDFPATYIPKKSWNSYVRRRQWIRYRRYCALNSWCAVAPLHKDPTQEPFIDVAIGGTNVPNSVAGTLIVWAVTAYGRAMFRSGVSMFAPEGLRWIAIPTPPGSELSQLSVGPTGLVWAVLSSGKALVRSGVTRDNLSGEAWLDVKPPTTNNSISDALNSLKILHVSVGTDAVWCVTNDNNVWFRRGIKGEASGISEDAAIGSGWVEMIGSISIVSVAANDQVFAVGYTDRALYYRLGVSASDPTGKKWCQINLSMQISRTSSSMSIVSRKSSSGSTSCSKHKSFSNLYCKDKEKAVIETCAPIENVSTSNSSLQLNNSFNRSNALMNNDRWKHSSESPPNVGSLNLLERHKDRSNILRDSTQASSAPAAEVTETSGKYYETQLKNPRTWSPVRSVGSVVGMEAHPESDSTVFNADSPNYGSDAFLGDDDNHTGSQFWTQGDTMWCGLTAGAVCIDPNNLPNWFNEQFSVDCHIDLNAVWRLDILNKFRKRQFAINSINNISKYIKAVDMTSWIKSAEARYQSSYTTDFEDSLIELEWVNTNSASTPANQNCLEDKGNNDSGTFTVLNPDGVTTKIQVPLSNITCVQCCSEAAQPRIAIHAPCLSKNSSPIRLQFTSDAEMEDWLSHLTSVCCQINMVMGRPANNSIWATTDIGEVFVFDSSNMKSQQWDKQKQCYTQIMDVSTMETPYYNTLYSGMPFGTELEISGCVYDDADQIRFDLQCHPKMKVCVEIEKYRLIALHVNPRFNEKNIVLNSMNDSEWMDEVHYKQMLFAPGCMFILKISALDGYYSITVNDVHMADYKYRIDPAAVNCLYVSGRVKLFNVVYRCPILIVNMQEMFWRQIGGHIKRVFTCGGFSGVVWGITCDNTAWVYNNGWGGNFLKGIDGGSGKINVMVDTHIYYVYENQRWNPISGFTTKSLPTDRYMWSDITGRRKRSKEHTKLLSSHYEWTSDWMIDFHIPGGTDQEGWQYAIDFPVSYHAQKRLTDCVRRRRWLKKCRLVCSGPWQELSHSKIIDAALQVLDIDRINIDKNNDMNEIPVNAWAIASNGDVLLRHGVTNLNPKGTNWEHLPSEQPLVGISISPTGQVWAVGRNGIIFYRYGITKKNPLGEYWQSINAPAGVHFKSIAVGSAGVWALDNKHRLAVRKEISQTFPEGSCWQFLPNSPKITPNTELLIGFKTVSVGVEVWAIAMNGTVCRRCGITKDNPAGVGWNVGIPGQWQNLTVAAFE